MFLMRLLKSCSVGIGMTYFEIAYNGKEATVNRALDGSTYPG
jgi:hypothetical protein